MSLPRKARNKKLEFSVQILDRYAWTSGTDTSQRPWVVFVLKVSFWFTRLDFKSWVLPGVSVCGMRACSLSGCGSAALG